MLDTQRGFSYLTYRLTGKRDPSQQTKQAYYDNEYYEQNQIIKLNRT